MWMPDLTTLFLILSLINLILTVMIFIFWKNQKTYDGFRIWMLSLLFLSCGYFLYVLWESVPVLFSSTVANFLIVLSVMMRLDGAKRYFQSKPLPVILYGVLIPAAFLLFWFMIISDSVVIRGVTIGLIIVPCFVATALLSIRSKEPETRSIRYSFAAGFLVMALLWTTIIILGVFTPGDHSLNGPDPLNPIFFTVAILLDVVSTGSFLILNMARSQTRLRTSEERYRNLADNLPDYIIVHDGESVLYANPEAARLLGSTRKSLVGQSIYSFLTAASAGALRAFITAIRSGENPVPLSEISIQLPDNTIRHCLIKTIPIEHEGILAFLSVITDITGRKTAEDALFRVNRKLTILSSITRHDIKNQLTALMTYLELSKEYVDIIPQSGEYLKKEMQIARTMEVQIDFTRIYEDMGTTAPIWQNLSASVQRAKDSLPLRNVRVEVDRTDLEIFADPLFEKVTYNLIDNALKYGGEAMNTIRISSVQTHGGCKIIFEDNGVGISGQDKAHLFERGYGKNTGLGLFLSREILSITGIMISETGEPEKGARIEILVPKDCWRVMPDTKE